MSKIAFVAYGEKSTAQIPRLVGENWYSINSYADQRGKQLDKAVWATLLNAKLDIDIFVIISDFVVPFETLRWAEFCSMHGIKFRLNIDKVQWQLEPYCDYGIEQPKGKRIGKVERVAIQIDPLVLKLMRSSKQWEYLKRTYDTYYENVRKKREEQDENYRDYQASRLLYQFTDADWKTIKRQARIYCLPSVILELYRLLEKDAQHDVLHNDLVPEFTGYKEFFRACWTTKNWFVQEVLQHAYYAPTGFTNTVNLEQFVQFWRPIYDITPSMTDIEAATSISYFLLVGIAPELKDVHVQLIPKNVSAVGRPDVYFRSEEQNN